MLLNGGNISLLRGCKITTIAASKEQIAGDCQANHNGGLKFKMTSKVHEFFQPLLWPTKFYVGFCGNVDDFPPVMAYLSDPTQFKKPPKSGNVECLVLTDDKKMFTFTNPSQWLVLQGNKHYAVGSGMNYAMAAMECGKTPLEAVKVASKFDKNTGMGFTHFEPTKK